VAVRGNVVDVRFSPPLPLRYHALRTGEEDAVVLEVQTHLNADTVRCIALTVTQGLARGMSVIDTNGMLDIALGGVLLGRMLNVFGEAIDGKGTIEASQHWPIHRAPLPLARRMTSTSIFELLSHSFSV
jgi:F-type H+-transporting ATPase subunit beta